MYGVLLIAVLIITGGAIAFIGDRLGTKIGKKRLSIFGLRPRHTSIVITIFTGICITTLTFGVMAGIRECPYCTIRNGTSEPYDAGDADKSESDAGCFAGCAD